MSESSPPAQATGPREGFWLVDRPSGAAPATGRPRCPAKCRRPWGMMPSPRPLLSRRAVGTTCAATAAMSRRSRAGRGRPSPWPRCARLVAAAIACRSHHSKPSSACGGPSEGLWSAPARERSVRVGLWEGDEHCACRASGMGIRTCRYKIKGPWGPAPSQTTWAVGIVSSSSYPTFGSVSTL